MYNRDNGSEKPGLSNGCVMALFFGAIAAVVLTGFLLWIWADVER